jgi:hypothetical protein
MKKLVKEHINEISLDGSHLERMNVGEKARIKRWLDDMNINDYHINDDFTIDAERSVDIRGRNITIIPVKFRIVKESFLCSNNLLISLNGCPDEVGKNFACSNNRLTSLKGCPAKVGRNFSCYNNIEYFSLEDVRNLCEVGEGIILTNSGKIHNGKPAKY